MPDRADDRRQEEDDAEAGERWTPGTRRQTRHRLGERIDHLRRERGLSLEELGGLSMIEPEEIEEILRGEREAFADHLLLLAGALGVEPGALMAGSRWVPPARGGPRYEVAEGGQDG